jgi:uncharacterized membrane protein
MIRRGTSHVLYDKVEVMQRVKRPLTVALLMDLMWMYEEFSRAELFRAQGVPVGWDNYPAFTRLMRQTKRWLSPPITLNFGPVTDPERERKRLRRKARREANKQR